MNAQAAILHNEIVRTVEANPVIVSRFVATQGDGLLTAQAWSWVDSFRAELEDSSSAAATFLKRVSDVRVTKHAYICTTYARAVTLPLAVNQRIRIQSIDGIDQGTFIILYLATRQWKGHTYAYDALIEQLQ